MENIQPIVANEIEKERINQLKFPDHKVLTKSEDIKRLQNALHQATSLGNLSKHKVQIYFEDSEGLKCVNTTVWAITEHNIMLKSGMSIPIHRIHDVKLL
ncbi:MAG: hypothetical protein JJU02_07720 [Cryomorphaceae bacterium]|nr:hypothetical protein [Cryomorphaceae bacterium]